MATDHPLDRPVWSALATRQAALALGDARARRFAPEYGLFAGAADASPACLAALAALIPAGGRVGIVEIEDMPTPPGVAVVSRALCCQMIAPALAPGEPSFAITPLTDADASEMLALATLTEPGPYFARTHQMGDFVGVRQDGVLVAMAGERLKPEGFTEVSAVCTHPDHRGRGYAKGLTRLVAKRILARGETPFLHVYAHRSAAIALYETLGFGLRTENTLTVLTRA